MFKRLLSIAGSDSGGGAGIQADLKTFSAFGVYGMTVLTAVTAQNTIGVQGISGLSPDFVRLQFDSVWHDLGIDAVKTGMLFDTGVVQVVAECLMNARIPHVVVDPVMIAKGGDSLLEDSAVDAVKKLLFPLADLVTPNIPEAERLSEHLIITREDMKKAAEIIYDSGCRAVLIKGGHYSGEAVDILFDGHGFQSFVTPRIESKNTHGTGCTFSSAIASCLAKGYPLPEAIQISKNYIFNAIKNALPLGKGQGPLNHFVGIDLP